MFSSVLKIVAGLLVLFIAGIAMIAALFTDYSK